MSGPTFFGLILLLGLIGYVIGVIVRAAMKEIGSYRFTYMPIEILSMLIGVLVASFLAIIFSS